MRRLVATLVVGGMLVLGMAPAVAGGPLENGTFCDAAGEDASLFVKLDENGAATWVDIVQAQAGGLSTFAPPTPAAGGASCKPTT